MDTPSPFDDQITRGVAASQAGRSEEALALFQQASEADPASGVPHFLIGSEHAGAGDFPAAELAFAQAVLLAPGFPLARYQLGLLQYTSRRVPLALLTWEPLLAQPDSEALKHFVLGFRALAQDAFEEALGHYRTGLACNPPNAPLCSDIVQLTEAVERLQRRAAPPAGTDGQHVLLSAYARGLH